ncbi:MAG: hypothetical protein AAFO02_15485 [Bacteroidota bacterium]
MTDEFNPSPRLGDRLEAVLEEAKLWGKITANDLRFRVASLTLSERAELEGSIRSRVKARDVDLEAIAFSFPRHGIFLEHGVGRGRPVGSALARRYAKKWLAPTLDVGLEELADILEKEYADVVADELRLLIPGIIDTKIKVNG